MKYILLYLLMPIIANAQGLGMEYIFSMQNGKVHYEKIVNINSANKSEIYRRAKTWLLSHTSLPNASLSEDIPIGLIVGEEMFSEIFSLPFTDKDSTKSEWQYRYVLKIYSKDKKAKIVIDNVRLLGNSGNDLHNIEDFKTEMQSYSNYLSKKHLDIYTKATNQNFSLANKKILSTINDIEKYLTGKQKAESDF